ncbi:MAG: hypothetical protein WD118_10665 [Phycisphaeraceae bacterium]
MDGGYDGRSVGQSAWLAAAILLVVTLLTAGGWLAVTGLSNRNPAPSEWEVAPASPGKVAFGAPRLVAGVPWGFEADRRGAAAAALSAVAVTGQPEVVFDRARFEEVAAVVFDPAQAAVQSRQVAAARSQLEVSGWADQPSSRRMYHFAPLAVRVVAFEPERPAAQVEVWAMTLVGVGDAGGAVFTTSSLDLIGDGADGWRVVEVETVQGPVPVVEAGPSAPGRVRSLVRDATAPLPLPALSSGDR